MNRSRGKKWIILVVLALIIKVLSLFPAQIEKFYTQGFYSGVSKSLRFLFGWLPFSIGDVLYTGLIILVIVLLARVIKRLLKGKLRSIRWGKHLNNTLLAMLGLYIIFYALWGLNYSRPGIEKQFGLNVAHITVKDLDTLVQTLHARINRDAAAMTVRDRDSLLNTRFLFKQSNVAYRVAKKEYPFLNNTPVSVKPSLFSEAMNYIGIQGYYNPFSGEAQVNTTIPVFLLPSVVTHEIGHQVGYAKESEANFMSFLTSRKHPSIHFQYSTDFVMYLYAASELYRLDSVKVKQYDSTLHPQVKKDIKTYIGFYKKYQNRIEPVIHWLYGNYLRANNQPSGNRSYDEVVIWLIGWYRKYGREAI
ncbi:hypothetical protein NIASO_09870 [Niabella soli DSM 19437]|uniref:Amino acid permease n=2 Tax=Niabella TaxID=379899 RepID=W0F0M7_9BACT|nr:hypothetical protein NIASO_09870 [Niabella soli DSM 19437]